jgi:hypothetical protein
MAWCLPFWFVAAGALSAVGVEDLAGVTIGPMARRRLSIRPKRSSACSTTRREVVTSLCTVRRSGSSEAGIDREVATTA